MASSKSRGEKRNENQLMFTESIKDQRECFTNNCTCVSLNLDEPTISARISFRKNTSLHLMATSVSASYAAAGDVSPQRLLQRPSQPQQSILPLRRERTSLDNDTYRNRLNSLYYSHDVSNKSAAFSGGKRRETLVQFSTRFDLEKQYERRQASSQVRSAKSEEVKRFSRAKLFESIRFLFEVFRLIDRRLQTGVHGVRHMFRSNDPNREGKLSKYEFSPKENLCRNNFGEIFLETHFDVC